MHFFEFVTHKGSGVPFDLTYEPIKITRDNNSGKYVTMTLESLEDNVAIYSLDSSNWPGVDQHMLFGVMNTFLNKKGYILIIN